MTKKSSTSYILLADQPCQANAMAKIGNEILLLEPSASISLVFTDYFTFFLRSDYLSGMNFAFPGKIYTQKDIFKGWQDETNGNNFDQDFLDEWEKKYCLDRSLTELSMTNQWIYGNERNRYQRRIEDPWPRKILYDTVKWCDKVFKELLPDVIVSIERCTLPTNLLFQIARTTEIPFLTFIPSRIGSRWILRDDLAYGTSLDFYHNVLMNYSDTNSILLARKFSSNMMARHVGSYESPSHKIAKLVENRKSLVIKGFLKELRLWSGRVYGRIFIQPKERSVKAKRLLENFIMLSYVELRRIIILHCRALGFRFWGKSTFLDDKYFLWALHMRPEGSVLVCGDARDEIVELMRTANLIPRGHFLVVKENPEMFGLRERRFYRKLRKHRRIKLVDPFISTFELIKNSTGVIGISGTVLLEAALFGKPTCALGKPEFDRFLVRSGWNSAESFIQEAIDGKYSKSEVEKILPYIAFVLRNSNETDIPFESDLLCPEAHSMFSRFAKTIVAYKNA